MKVGLIGVGTMGTNIARRLLEAGFSLVARDIKPEAAKRAKEMGAEVALSPREVAEKAAIVLMSLPGPADVQEVVYGEEGLLSSTRPLHVIVDTSTVDPSCTRRNAARAAEKRVEYLDAPVLGRPQACGNWTLPVGGDEGALEATRPVLSVIAKKIIYVGSPGSGNIVKLLNNAMFGAINAVTAEVMAVSAKLGVNPKVLYDTIADSGAATVSKLFIELGLKMLNRDFTPLFTVDLLYKDMALALATAYEAGMRMPATAANQVVNEIARLKGFGQEDTSAIVKVYEEMFVD